MASISFQSEKEMKKSGENVFHWALYFVRLLNAHFPSFDRHICRNEIHFVGDLVFSMNMKTKEILF